MHLDFAVLADGVSPRADGKLDIYGAGFDTIFASAVPAQHPRLVLALRVGIDQEEVDHEHQVDVVIQDTEGSELARAHVQLSPLPMELRSAMREGRQLGLPILLNFENVVFPSYGDYELVIRWDGEEAQAPLRLYVQEPPVG